VRVHAFTLAVALLAAGALALGMTGTGVGRVAAGLAVGAMGVLSWAFGRSLRQPLSRLTAFVQAVTEGRLDESSGPRREDELGELARAVERMADSVSLMMQSQTQMLANLSHELRTPLARVRVALELASDFEGPGAQESLRSISEDLGELEQLFGDVLALARFELAEGGAARLEGLLRMELLEPGELVARAVARFRAAHPARVLRLHLEEPLPRIRGDGRLLRRVLDNLLENGRKYSDPSRELALRALRTGDALLLEVVDAGIGIDAEDLPHVFTPFFRAERSRSRATGGVGLGLTLALRIAEAHGGTLKLSSTRGVGTTASLRVPVAGAPEARPPGAPRAR
jgi:signal transduction histidine kinase